MILPSSALYAPISPLLLAVPIVILLSTVPWFQKHNECAACHEDLRLLLQLECGLEPKGRFLGILERHVTTSLEDTALKVTDLAQIQY